MLGRVCAFDPSGIPPQCEAPCAQADLEGFNACFDLVMSAPCRSRLCEAWYVNATMGCLSCVTDHVTGPELDNFASIIDVYNSTCNNRSLVVSSGERSGPARPRDSGFPRLRDLVQPPALGRRAQASRLLQLCGAE